MNYKKKTFWIITVALIASVTVAICFLIYFHNSKTTVRCIEKNEFISILEKDLNLIEDKEPFAYSLSGRDNGIYRIIADNEDRTQINGYWGDSDICYMFFPVSSIAQDSFDLPYNLYAEGVYGSFEEYVCDEYEYFVFDGYFEGTYWYGAIFHVDNMILQVYTNENSDKAREDTAKLLEILKFPNV
ncbi:MAG: hypothetical protein MJ093_07470 [Saccharofermentans sp.]|nr:hypothetical protein [Saccharofermentans sp.]